ncbi:MAG: cytochrome-c oxidase, cbb3-type subunit III [Rhizobiaceae bacterium]
MSEKEFDAFTGTQTTGHEWDGIKELDTPMPKWWLWTFYATILFSIGYMIYYPAIPLVEGSTMGISGQTNRAALRQETAVVEEARREIVAGIESKELDDIRSDDQLNRFALAGGASLFKVHCSQCHGSGAAGSPGYPNLNDDDWIWGGDVASIYTTIKHGVRDESDDDTRYSEMPAFGTDEVLEDTEIASIAEYVLKISGQEFDAAQATSGEALFVDNCAACHGETGLGDREQGAPNLADAISLYGADRAKLIAQMNQPKHGVMPAWGSRLTEAGIKQLAIYVHGLGGGEKSATE